MGRGGEVASQQSNSMVSHSLCPTRSSYKGVWMDRVLRRGQRSRLGTHI